MVISLRVEHITDFGFHYTNEKSCNEYNLKALVTKSFHFVQYFNTITEPTAVMDTPLCTEFKSSKIKRSALY